MHKDLGGTHNEYLRINVGTPAFCHLYPHQLRGGEEKRRAIGNRVCQEVHCMLNPFWLLLGGLGYSLQLAPGSFPRALTKQEERDYLARSRQGDLDARNKLIEHNLRLVAHITKDS